jgi:hypothetical protein
MMKSCLDVDPIASGRETVPVEIGQVCVIVAIFTTRRPFIVSFARFWNPSPNTVVVIQSTARDPLTPCGHRPGPPETTSSQRACKQAQGFEEPRLFKTCMFTSYMDEYVPAIMREVNSLYEVDYFYTNGWPPLGSLPDCHCSICSNSPNWDLGLLARLYRPCPRAMAEMRRDRQREKGRQLLLRRLRRQRARWTQSRSPRQGCRMVPG